MRLLRVGDRIINLDLVTHVDRDDSGVTVYFAAGRDGEGVGSIQVTGDEAQTLWSWLIGEADRGR